jgi:hypothetical protein
MMRNTEHFSFNFHPIFGHINGYQFINKTMIYLFLKANLFMCKKAFEAAEALGQAWYGLWMRGGLGHG